MNSKILFIIPPALPLDQLEKCGAIDYDSYIPTSIPIGVLSISAYLRKYSNADIKILDFNVILNRSKGDGKGFKDKFIDCISELIKNFKPEIVGISALFNSNFSYLKLISEYMKDVCPNSMIIAGGGLPTNLYYEVLEEASSIEAICFAEGEIPILELVNACDKEKYLSSSDSWITREKLGQNFCPKANYVINLDEISLTSFDLIDFMDYQKFNRYHGEANDSIAISIMTSRGCPFRCCFCASHSVHGKKIRMMSAERVLEDIDWMIKEFGINTLLIEDDHFLIDKKRALQILEGLEGKGLNIEFPNGVAVYAIDEDIAEALRKAGVRMVTLAIESGSEYVLRNIIHKPLKLSIVSEVVDILRRKSIYIRAFFIIGFPGESEEYRDETIRFIRDTGFNWVAIMIATPIAGSELYRICKENEYLVSMCIEDFHYGKANIKTNEFTPEYIEEKRYLMNLDLNFINNYDLLNNDYNTALIGFKDVIKRVQDHAFAYYFAAICYKKLENFEEYYKYMNMYNKIINTDPKWRNFSEYFNINCEGDVITGTN